MADVHIYGLIDPRNDKFFYVGSSISPEYRYYTHMKGIDRTSATDTIKELQSLGLKPGLQVLENVGDRKRSHREKHWITKMIKDGQPLVNVWGRTSNGALCKDDGDQTTCATITVAVYKSQSDKIEELSKKFGVAKGGIVRELIAYALEHIDSVKETQPT